MIRRVIILLSALVIIFLILFAGTGITDRPLYKDKLTQISRPELIKDSQERKIKQITLRVRNSSCNGILSGSAFIAGKHTIITNRHVIDGAWMLEMNTWDGRSIYVPLKRARVARLVDIGAIYSKKVLEPNIKSGPSPSIGEDVTAVGYPEGGELQLIDGKVKGYISGKKLLGIGYRGKVMVVSTKIKPGNSGGPLLDSEGRIVGVVFAGSFRPITEETLRGYVIPLSEVFRLAKKGGGKPISRKC